jgi:hypothetical protein
VGVRRQEVTARGANGAWRLHGQRPGVAVVNRMAGISSGQPPDQIVIVMVQQIALAMSSVTICRMKFPS